MPLTYKKLGEILVEMGAITPKEVALILEKMESPEDRFGETGVREGLFKREVLAQALARQFHLTYLDLTDFAPDPGLMESIPGELLLQYRFVPVRHGVDGLVIAVADPTEVVNSFDYLERLLDTRLILQVAEGTMIDNFLDLTRGSKEALKDASKNFKLQLVKETDQGEEVLSIEKLDADVSPIIRLVDSTLMDALKKKASDIHFESSMDGVVIKYRVDGVLLRATDPLDGRFQGPIVSRIKVMSELDISERRIPQDGRFKARIGDKSIDFRVSIMPSIFGEDVVIRILDKDNIASDLHGLSLDALGFSGREQSRFRRKIREPHGMVLVTGPTGSGKTTTLYAALSEIHNDEEKIITIEDPVEYQVKGVVQIPVNEKKGLTFARGLRSILRHDPDKIMVGEIRDSETAQIAVQSALTGHLVFTTVHANNVFDVLGRFLHMGLDPYHFVTSLNCILAQRLVRKICRKCRQQVTYDQEILEASGLEWEKYREHPFFEGRGCSDCNGTGYKGRSAIVEFLELDDDLRELIVAKVPVARLKKEARKSGTFFLREVGMEKVLDGETTIRELNRVTFAYLGSR